MYKTVRHGENSLQYKILAQQEEGVTNFRCRRSHRAVTLKLFTVVILLIVGITASAVLIPLILTNDFLTLTGTFQKFSVSTLRRTHSGNHVVVIAKKPYGWNPAHSSAPPKMTNASQNHSYDAKLNVLTIKPPSTSKPTSTLRTTLQTIAMVMATRRTTPKVPEETIRPTFTKEQTAASTDNEESSKIRPTSTTEEQKSFHTEGERVSSTSRPGWFEPVEKWEFRPPQINSWMETGVGNNTLYIFLAGCVVFCLIIFLMFLVLRKTISGRRNVTQKVTAESKEDKARLLKPSARGSDEE